MNDVEIGKQQKRRVQKSPVRSDIFQTLDLLSIRHIHICLKVGSVCTGSCVEAPVDKHER